MHPNAVFHDRTAAENLAFAADRAFGTLAVSGEGGPVLAHVPFLLDAAAGVADLHLVRSNPVIPALDRPQPAVIAVTGADGYVSPDWYGLADQVPTWNYVAVHLRGSLERRPQTEIAALLERQSAAYEAKLAPKPAWSMAKMSDDVRDRLMRMIVPCRLRIDAVDGTWKLSQNKPEAARLAAAAQVELGFGQELTDLAALMHAGHLAGSMDRPRKPVIPPRGETH